MRTAFLLFASAALFATSGAPANANSVTKTSTTEFNIGKEVVAFVKRLTADDPRIAAQYKRLAASTEEEAGGRFALGEFEAIEWLVPDFQVDFGGSGGTRDGEFTIWFANSFALVFVVGTASKKTWWHVSM